MCDPENPQFLGELPFNDLHQTTLDMGGNKYRPIREEEHATAVGRDSTSEIIPTKISIAYLSLLLISLSTNVLLLLQSPPKTCPRDLGQTRYSGITFDTPIAYHSFTEYWNHGLNQSAVDETWDALDTDPMAISLHDNYAKEVGLPPSTRFPWDTERSVYYLKGFHDLHCLKLIRKGFIMSQHGLDLPFSTDHVFHCLDGLRQDIICLADDTPMPAVRDHHIGDGQIRQCRSWEKMTAWATRPDQHACHRFDDYREATNTLELFAFCPHDSPYRSTMNAYFQLHGHKDPYQVSANVTT